MKPRKKNFSQRRKSRRSNFNRHSFQLLEDRRMLATFTVTNTSDSVVTAAGDAPGSLRQAIFDANTLAGADTITFDSNVFTGGDASLIRLTNGELEITDSLTLDASSGIDVTITGDANGDDITTAANITDVSASFGGTAGTADDLLDDNSRVLNISGFETDLTLESLTITGGRTTENNSIIPDAFGTIFTNTYSGGGIRLSGGALNLTDSTVSGNSTVGSQASGGGIFSTRNNVILTNSTVSGNTATGDGAGGGGIAVDSVGVTLINSTVSGNTASDDGGGINVGFGGVTLTNSTVTRNTAGDNGGGIATTQLGQLRLTNSTVSGNTAGGVGGGIDFQTGSTAQELIVFNSIITGNTDNGTFPDFEAFVGLVFFDSSIVGDSSGVFDFFGGVNNQLNVDFTTVLETEVVDGVTVPLLADNGGSVETIALLAGGPAIDAGNNEFAVDSSRNPLQTDQRGPGFGRIGNGTVDIGAFESPADTVISGLVVDSNGDGVDGDFSAGEVTLREAIEAANFLPGADTITFAPSFSGSTIALTDGELVITDDLTILGPGAEELVIDAQRLSGVIRATSRVTSLTLDSLTISNGQTSGDRNRGGGIQFDGSTGSTLNLSNSTVTGNTTTGLLAGGGGIYIDGGDLILTNSTVSENSTQGDLADGGGISSGGGTVTLNNSTVSGNTTFGGADGGGIFSRRGTVTLTNSTVSGNSATGDFANGGGIYGENGSGVFADNDAIVTLTNSTVSGNTADGAAGGIGFDGFRDGGTLTVHNSIIAGNSDNGTAPDFQVSQGSFFVQNSIIGDTTGSGLSAGNNNQLNVDFTTVLETEVVDGITVPLLTDNGGSVETIALLANSPAIDAGDNALAVDAAGNPLLNDQRADGFDRIFGGTVDIGAVEFEPSAFVLGDVNGDGVVDFSDIPSFISILQAGDFLDEADINGDGVVDFDDISFFIELLIAQ